MMVIVWMVVSNSRLPAKKRRIEALAYTLYSIVSEKEEKEEDC